MTKAIRAGCGRFGAHSRFVLPSAVGEAAAVSAFDARQWGERQRMKISCVEQVQPALPHAGRSFQFQVGPKKSFGYHR